MGISILLLASLVFIQDAQIRAPLFLVASGFPILGYLPRIITIHRWFTEQVTTASSNKLAKAVLAQIALNLLLFFYGGHVERFRRWSDASLFHLCDCVKPIVYAERTRIVCEGDPINEMLFVLQGKLGTFSSEDIVFMNNVPPHDRKRDLLKDGDFWGEELVNWVHDESSSSSS
ncbi:hypothetical protein LWI29_019340 [Acer saccharum]|uniref:Cyclic nucleotide-binding domain-containing protein n=1 Tax=Acer saccharum TaxID=4024 RepID=A0AA39VZH2_ACESA|nr:hypothetical protein LWI29_019340 [Acer saccharum]